MLYQSLGEHGVMYVPSAHLGQSWLREMRGKIDFIHLHWPGYSYENNQKRISIWLLINFIARIWFGRLLGYRFLWTVHNLFPHDRQRGVLAWVARFLVVHSVNIILVNFDTAKDDIARLFLRRKRVHVVPHGNYRLVYPEIPSQALARERLGIESGTRNFILFGGINPYKGAHAAIEAFKQLKETDLRLYIVGQCLQPSYQKLLTKLSNDDNRIRLNLGKDDLPDIKVVDWIASTDVVLAPYREVYTSGVLHLATTFGKPIVAPQQGVFKTLNREAFAYIYSFEEEKQMLPNKMIAAICQFQDQAVAKSAKIFADRHDWSFIAKDLTIILQESLRIAK